MTSIFSIRQRVGSDLAHWLVAKRPGDQYVASYPRSGNTWLRTMLVNVSIPSAHSDPDVFNQTLPGISLRNLPTINRLAGERILKTHTWYRPKIERAVYLVRDGRDAVVSYYHYLITRNGLGDKISFSDFFADYCVGNYGQLWHQNVISWMRIGCASLGDQLLVIRFEEMKADPIVVLTRVVDFLGIEADQESLRLAIEESRLENVRRIEQTRRQGISNPNMSFYRGGKSDQWREVFTPEQEQKFTDISRDALELAGYLQ